MDRLWIVVVVVASTGCASAPKATGVPPGCTVVIAPTSFAESVDAAEAEELIKVLRRGLSERVKAYGVVTIVGGAEAASADYRLEFRVTDYRQRLGKNRTTEDGEVVEWLTSTVVLSGAAIMTPRDPSNPTVVAALLGERMVSTFGARHPDDPQRREEFGLFFDPIESQASRRASRLVFELGLATKRSFSTAMERGGGVIRLTGDEEE